MALTIIFVLYLVSQELLVMCIANLKVVKKAQG
jgi:hypothetical protein